MQQGFLKYLIRRSGITGSRVILLMTGTTIAQGLTILLAPLLTRLYAPTDYGAFASYSAIVGTLSIVVTGRYELAIMLPRDDEDAVNVGVLALLIALGVSVSSLVVIWLAKGVIISILELSSVGAWIYLIPVAVFLAGGYQCLSYWCSRKEQFGALSAARVIYASVSSLCSIALGFGGCGVAGLIVGGVLGQCAATGLLGCKAVVGNLDKARSIATDRMGANARAYSSFPTVNSLHALVDVLQSTTVIFLLSTCYSSTVLGWYALTMRVLKTPFAIIGTAVSQVFYQRASDTFNKGGDLEPLLKRTMTRLAIIALPLFLVIALLSPIVFALFFGNAWRQAGVYARLLCPWIFFSFIISPISQIPLIVGRQAEAFAITLVGNGLVLASIIIGRYVASDVKVGFVILSGLLSVYMLFFAWWVVRISKRPIPVVAVAEAIVQR